MGERASRRRRHRLSTRIRALLTAGIVLGVGSGLTAAAWTDTEYATGSFATSVFDTESQSAGSTAYASRPADPGATLTFAATAMSPGVSTYAWLNIRTTPASTVGGTVTLDTIASTGALAPALQYRAVRMAGPNPGSTCGAAAFQGSPTFIAGNATTYLTVSQVAATAVANPIGSAGAQLGFCVEVRVAPGSANTFQGQSGTVTWRFGAVSAS